MTRHPTAPTVLDPTRPVVDPRLQQRRLAVKRAEGRRRLHLLMLVLVLAATVGGAWGVARSPVLDVDRVDLRGAHHTEAPAVVRVAGLDRGAFMLDVDGRDVVRRVQRLPWVARARVRRQWPGTVVITIVERTPAAMLSVGPHRWALVDGEGRVLSTAEVPLPGLPVVEGLPAPEAGRRLDATGRAALRIAGGLPAAVSTRLEGVVVRDDEIDLRLRLSAGSAPTVARLGRPERVPEKLKAIELLLSRLDLRSMQSLDVRAPASPVVTRRP